MARNTWTATTAEKKTVLIHSTHVGYSARITGSHGYVAEVDPETCDFEKLVEIGYTIEDPQHWLERNERFQFASDIDRDSAGYPGL